MCDSHLGTVVEQKQKWESRYSGLAKTHLQHIMTATAMNCSPMLAWLIGVPLDETRTSRFAALALKVFYQQGYQRHHTLKYG